MSEEIKRQLLAQSNRCQYDINFRTRSVATVRDMDSNRPQFQVLCYGVANQELSGGIAVAQRLEARGVNMMTRRVADAAPVHADWTEEGRGRQPGPRGHLRPIDWGQYE